MFVSSSATNIKVSGDYIMRKGKFVFIFIVLIIVALAVFYKFYVNVFTVDNLKSIDILSGENAQPVVFQLNEDETNQLFQSLSSYESIESIPEMDSNFVLTLINRWNLSKKLNVYFYEDGKVAIQEENDKHIYMLTDPLFFHGHPGFDLVYRNAFLPEFNLKVEEDNYPVEVISGSWAFKRLNGNWVEQEASVPDIEPNYQTVEITSSSTAFALNSSKRPDTVYLKIETVDSKELVFEGPVDVDALPLPEMDGSFYYSTQLLWNEGSELYKGELGTQFRINVNRPAEIHFSKTSVVQGDFIEIDMLYAETPDELVLEQNLFENFKWIKSGTSIKGFVPTNYYTAVGKYSFIFTNESKGTSSTNEVEVLPRDYKVQSLTVDPNVSASTRNDAAYAEYNQYFVPARNVSNETRYFDTPFVFPTIGRLTTEFGEKRTVNGELTSYRHNGYDIGAPEGADVIATNAGKVVLAMKMIMTGNTIIIDHGGGLFSAYEHLSELLVEEGQMVEQSELIAKVGSTGFSTGPHLHFLISYYDINLEPGFFIYGVNLTKENYTEYIK